MSAPIGDSIRRRHGGASRPPRADRPRVRWARVALFGLLGAGAAFGIGYAVAVLLLFPAPAAAAPGIATPSLVGQDTLSAGSALGRLGLRLGAVTPLPDPTAAPGTIVAQDALAGQQLRRGGLVNVAVSTGPARAVLPNVSGYGASRATALLGALGFQVSQQQMPDPAPAGRVVRVSPGPGAEYVLPASVLLTVSSGPPPPDTTTLPDSTAAADSGRATPPGAAGMPATPGTPGTRAAPGMPATPGAPGVPRALPAAPGGGARSLPAPPAARDTVRHGAPGEPPRGRTS